MNRQRLYRTLRRRNAGALTEREQLLIQQYLQRPESQNGEGLTAEQATEAVAMLQQLASTPGSNLTAAVIVQRIKQVAEVFRGTPTNVPPADLAPTAPTPAPAPAPPPPAPTRPEGEPTSEEAALGLTKADLAFIESYYEHFRREDRRYAKRRPTKISTKSAYTKAAVLQVLRLTRNGAQEAIYWPEGVKNPPRYLGALTFSAPKGEADPQEGYGFKVDSTDKKIRFQMANAWGGNWTSPSWRIYAILARRMYGSSEAQSDIRELAANMGVSAQWVSELAKVKDRWSFPFADLLPAWQKRAEEASTSNPDFNNYYPAEKQTSSGYKPGQKDVYFAYSRFLIDRDSEYSIRVAADRLETAGQFPLAAFLRIAYGGQYMEVPSDEALYFMNRAPRLEDKVVTGPPPFATAGTQVNVIGLAKRNIAGQIQETPPAGLVDDLKTLAPPMSFRARAKKGSGVDYYYPFDYQKVGIAYLLRNNGIGLIGDEMGLGKTIQALGFLSVRINPVNGQKSLPAVVVCPGSVVTNWRDEINQWLPDLRVSVFGGSNHVDEPHDVMVTSWDKLGLYPERFHSGNYQTFIGDEAHYVKNLYASGGSGGGLQISIGELLGETPVRTKKKSPYTRRTAGFLLAIHSIPNRILLTGTPVSNGKMKEWWTLLNGMNPTDYPELKGFLNDYSPTQADIERAERTGSDPYEKLIEGVGDLMIRRKKQDVADQTSIGFLRTPGNPPVQFGADKLIDVLTIDLTPEQETYLEIMDEGLDDLVKRVQRDQRIGLAVKAILNGKDPFTVLNSVNEIEVPEKVGGLAALTYQRQYVGELKVSNAICWIEEKAAAGEPVVVWAYHKNVVAALAEVLKNYNLRYAVVDGDASPKQKGQAVKDFQAGKLDVIVGSTSMAEGVTLTRSRFALFVEYWWQPGKVTQAQDRIFRVGQERDVTVTTLHAPGTIDDQIDEGIKGKMVRIDMMSGVDYYQKDASGTVLCPAAEPAMKILLRRIRERAIEGATQEEEITIDDVADALEGDPKNVEVSYALTDRYLSGDSLAYETRLLMSPDEAEAVIRATPKSSYTRVRAEILAWLAAQPNQTARRADLEAAMGKMKPAIKAATVASNIADLADLSIVTPFEEDENISWRAKKLRKIVEEMRAAGGSFDYSERKRLVPSSTKSNLADLVARGVVTTKSEPKIKLRNNPRRRPGQMVVHGRPIDLPTDPYVAVDLPRLERGSREAHADAKMRHGIRLGLVQKLRNAKRDKRYKLPSIGHASRMLKDAVAMARRRKTQEAADHAITAYMNLRSVLQDHKRAKQAYAAKYVKQLEVAHRFLAPHAGR